MLTDIQVTSPTWYVIIIPLKQLTNISSLYHIQNNVKTRQATSPVQLSQTFRAITVSCNGKLHLSSARLIKLFHYYINNCLATATSLISTQFNILRLDRHSYYWSFVFTWYIIFAIFLEAMKLLQDWYSEGFCKKTELVWIVYCYFWFKITFNRGNTFVFLHNILSSWIGSDSVEVTANKRIVHVWPWIRHSLYSTFYTSSLVANWTFTKLTCLIM